jgi:hypothetical protein
MSHPELSDPKTINPHRRGQQTSIRFSQKEWEIVLKMASKYTKGNLSVWIRQASLRFKPSKDDLKSE